MLRIDDDEIQPRPPQDLHRLGTRHIAKRPNNGLAATQPLLNRVNPGHAYSSDPNFSNAKNASCGTSTRPTRFIRRFPSACFSSNFRFRDTSPP